MNTNLWAGDLDGAADYCRRCFPSQMELTLSLANELLNNRFTFRDHWEMERSQEPVDFPGAVDWGRIPAGDPEWLYAMNRHTGFVNLGKAYRYTGEERYADKFAALISDWIDRVPLTADSKGTTWRLLEAGLRSESWLRSLRLFAGSRALTGALVRRIEDCLTVHGDYMAGKSEQFHRLSNWGMIRDHGLFLLGVYFDRRDYRELAAARMEEQLRLQVLGDGTHWEQSPLYHCEVLHCAIDVVTISRQNGIPLSEDFTRRTHAMCTALAKWLTPGGRTICQSDSDDMDARDLVLQGALLFEDGALRFAAGDNLFEEAVWDFGPQVLERYRAIRPLAPDHPSTVLPDSGNYLLREDLTPGAALLHLHCGSLGSGHGHADLLHIDLSARGEDILIDSGRYTYVDTPLRRQLKLPAAHNTTRVDGVNFSECADSWGYSRLAAPVKGECKFTPEADYISGGHLGYMTLPGGGVYASRQIVYLRPGVFVIADSFVGTGEHSCERFFHLGQGAAALDRDTLRWRGERAELVLCCLDADRCVMSRAPYSREYNSLREGDLLTAVTQWSGSTSLLTVAVTGDRDCLPAVHAERVPVTRVRLGQEIDPSLASAVRVTLDGEEYRVIICHGEAIMEVDLLSAEGRDGYGRVIAFTPGRPEGITLAW